MDWRLREIADRLAGDMASGAAEMMNSVLDGILAIPEGNVEAIPPNEWKDFAAAIHLGKPSIAPVFNIANAVMLLAEEGSSGISRIRGVLQDMLEQERGSGPRIAGEAVKCIKGGRFMTTSYSSTAARALLAIAKERPIRVTVAESSPGGEGRQFARLLSEHMDCEVIYDSTVFARMADMDGVIAGADSITGSGLINKVGTRALAEAARAYAVPAYAICGWSKMCPVTLTDLVVTEKSLGPRLSERVQVFESSPLELFTAILTDRGAMAPADLKAALQAGRVARGWYSRGILPPPELSRRSA